MGNFKYTARNKKGERVEGAIDANDRRTAMAQVEKLGLIPITMEERNAAKAETEKFFSYKARNDSMSSKEVLTFTEELSDLLSSGMTLGNALNSLANRRSGRSGDKIVTSLRDEIIRGNSLSEGMAKHPKTFSTLYVSMIKAGEASGAISEVLHRLVDHFERMQDLKEKVVMALVYPAIVLSMGLLTIIFSMVFVIPKFKVVFDSMGNVLPLPTRMLIGMSNAITNYGWAMAIVVILCVIMAKRAINTEKGRFWWDGLLLRMPLIKGIVACSLYANFARTLATLLSNGVALLQALSIVEKIVSNVVVANEIKKARARVSDGTTISGPLAAGKIFPTMMIDMMSVGEQTGDMEGSLNHIARRYENELSRNIKIFTTALEPILIVFIAIMVGFVAVSVLMAVFSMTNGLDV